MKKFHLALSFLCLSQLGFSQQFRADEAFGNRGNVITPIQQENEFSQAGRQVLEQSDGRLVVVFTGRNGTFSLAAAIVSIRSVGIISGW